MSPPAFRNPFKTHLSTSHPLPSPPDSALYFTKDESEDNLKCLTPFNKRSGSEVSEKSDSGPDSRMSSFSSANGPPKLQTSLVPYIWPTNPSSFLSGIVVGLALSLVRPTIEFYLDKTTGFVVKAVRLTFLWGSLALMAGVILKFVQKVASTMNLQAGAEQGVSDATQPTQQYSWPSEDTSAPSVYTAYTDRSERSRKSSRPLSVPAKSYTYSPPREYKHASNAKQASPTRSTPRSSHKSDFEIISGEDISVLEKPAGQTAFRIQRGY